MKFEIKNRFDGSLIFSCEADSWRAAIELAIKANVSLRSANLGSANLISANLRSANLRYANLEDTREDFLSKLSHLPHEAAFLYNAVIDGRINGSVYENNLGIKVDSSSPTEKLFLAIKKGDTPENNQVSAIVRDWIVEFMGQNGIAIPERGVTWSDE